MDRIARRILAVEEKDCSRSVHVPTIEAFDRRSDNATKARRAVVLTMSRPLFMPSKNRRRSP